MEQTGDENVAIYQSTWCVYHILLTFQLLWVTKTDILFAISMKCQVDKWLE